VEPSSPVEAFARQVAALGHLLGELEPHHWSRRAEPYDWDVLGLVAHLVVIERYTAGQLGVPGAARVPGGHHLRMGAAEIAAAHDAPAEATRADWAQVAARTVDALRAGSTLGADAPIDLHGWPFTVSAVLVLRAFELWAHADDIRRACGWPPSSPPPADLRTMSSFSVQSLPLLLGVVAPAVAMAPARVVLTGPGGATFDLGGDGPRAVTLVADVVDYCRLATRRVGRDEAGVVCEGDERLGDGLLAAAQAFAI
jgi:uncharacterized protein (TIGR03083 family)